MTFELSRDILREKERWEERLVFISWILYRQSMVMRGIWILLAQTNEINMGKGGMITACIPIDCFGLTSLLNILGHIATVPACGSGTLTNVQPHRNTMPQTKDMTPHPVTVYRHGAKLSLCYPLMWNNTLEYTATHLNVLGKTRPGNSPQTFHTHQRTLNFMIPISW